MTTLLLAGMLTTGWVRSTVVRDEIAYATGPSTGQVIAFVDSCVTWMSIRDVRPADVPNFPEWSLQPFEPIDVVFDGFSVDSTNCIHKLWICELDTGRCKVSIIPCWCLVTPLILISAYLLLSKPRLMTEYRDAVDEIACEPTER